MSTPQQPADSSFPPPDPIDICLPPHESHQFLTHRPRPSTPPTDPNDQAYLARLSAFATCRRAEGLAANALSVKEKKEKKEKKEEEKKKEREKEEGKRLFGGTLAEVLRVAAELKMEHPEVPDAVLEQEAWNRVMY
ncbi:hypothetical protein NHQ30_004917 [Ciborinia camelliae]|nr:hypothetical protein NHQ30_004917 [Ciborinia camelliae]